jgi:hypothetical protein
MVCMTIAIGPDAVRAPGELPRQRWGTLMGVPAMRLLEGLLDAAAVAPMTERGA